MKASRSLRLSSWRLVAVPVDFLGCWVMPASSSIVAFHATELMRFSAKANGDPTLADGANECSPPRLAAVPTTVGHVARQRRLAAGPVGVPGARRELGRGYSDEGHGIAGSRPDSPVSGMNRLEPVIEQTFPRQSKPGGAACA